MTVTTRPATDIATIEIEPTPLALGAHVSGIDYVVT